MRYGKALGILAMAACSATQALGQIQAPAGSDDSFRLRESIDGQEQKQRVLQRREHVMGATDQQAPAGAPIQRREEGVGGRLVILQDKMLKLQEDRALAVQQGKPVGAIDAEIARLQRELAVRQPAPVPAAR